MVDMAKCLIIIETVKPIVLKICPPTSSSIIQELVTNANSWAHPRLTGSETLRTGPSRSNVLTNPPGGSGAVTV